MSVVVDASVAFKWVVVESDSNVAGGLLLAERNLLAPDILALEVGNAICRKQRQRQIAAIEASEALNDFLAMPIAYTAHGTMLHDAAEVSLSQRHPMIDCLYLVLAQRSGAALATFDQPLSALAKRLGIPLWSPA